MGKAVITVPIVYTERFTEDELLEMVSGCNEVFARLLRMLIQLPVWPDQLTLRVLKRLRRLASSLYNDKDGLTIEAYSEDSYCFDAESQDLAEDCEALINRIDSTLSKGQGMAVPDIMKLQLIRVFFEDFLEGFTLGNLQDALDQAIETVEENIKESNK